MAQRIDAHQHVWDLAVRPQSWLDPPEMETIRRTFTVDDLRPVATAAGVTTTVLVQTVPSEDETREFLAIAAADPLVGAVTGWVDLTAPDVADRIAALRQEPGGGLLRAIRHGIQDEPDPDWLRRPDVERGLRAVSDAGLAFELLVKPHQLAACVHVARAVPDVRFVLDHCAKPRIAAGSLEPWRSPLETLAACPNVTCKLSGLGTEADWSGWTVDDLRPYTDVVLDAFGPARLMFGSDWPVCLLAGSYAGWVEAVEQITAGLSAAERGAVFVETAANSYGITPDAAQGPSVR